MRQRRLKDLDERKRELAAYIDESAMTHKGEWRKLFAEKAIAGSWELNSMLFNGAITEDDIVGSYNDEEVALCLEIGCGKGRFIADMAKTFPEWQFVGIEGQESVIVRAAEKVRDAGLINVHLASGYVDDVRDYFDEGELDKIFLNFSDPWPKAKHEKRRLTCKTNLEAYMTVLREGGTVEFKTDNDDLFAFTMAVIEELGYNVMEQTYDLHASGLEADDIKTEYEEKFIARGIKIKYVKFCK